MKTKSLAALLFAASATLSAWGYTYILNNSQPAPNGTGLPIKWPEGTVTIQLKLGTDRTLADGTNFNTSAQGAAQAWNAVMGDLQINSVQSSGNATDHNRANELVFASTVFGKAFDTNVIAVTTAWVSGNDRTEGDIIFNSARTWDSYDGPLRSALDLQRVAMHEMGHLLGLDHPDEASQSVTAIMNSRVSGVDTLTTDDIQGVQNLYGPPGTPANDNFANAIALTLSGNSATATGFNTNATKQPGEPNHAGNAGGRSIWWKWTAPGAGSVALDTRGSYCDTTLGVYTGSAVNSLTTITSNDDIQSGVVQASTVNFTATAGTTYFFAVDGFDADSSGVTLNLNFTPSGGTAPTITTQPSNQTTTAGLSASFTVAATAGTSTISYQWQFNGTAITGATSATLTLSNVTSANAGNYAVVVSTEAGTVTSNTVTLTVNAAPVVTPTPTPTTSGGGGGGGGAPSAWFLAALALLAGARWRQRR